MKPIRIKRCSIFTAQQTDNQSAHKYWFSRDGHWTVLEIRIVSPPWQVSNFLFWTWWHWRAAMNVGFGHWACLAVHRILFIWTPFEFNGLLYYISKWNSDGVQSINIYWAMWACLKPMIFLNIVVFINTFQMPSIKLYFINQIPWFNKDTP